LVIINALLPFGVGKADAAATPKMTRMEKPSGFMMMMMCVEDWSFAGER
jgi:hypothetical protein